MADNAAENKIMDHIGKINNIITHYFADGSQTLITYYTVKTDC